MQGLNFIFFIVKYNRTNSMCNKSDECDVMNDARLLANIECVFIFMSVCLSTF